MIIGSKEVRTNIAIAATQPSSEPSVKLTRYLCSAEYGKRTVGRRIAANDAFDAGCLFLARTAVEPAAVFIREVK